MRNVLRKAESVTAVDGPARAVADTARRVVLGSRAGNLLRGSWLGHPVHPLLVTLPIGAWTSGLVLDLTGRRNAARQLVAVGLAATPPTVLAGLADFADLDTRQRRVGLLHASANLVAAGAFLCSYRCRLRGRHRAGTVWSTLGLLAIGAGGALGGHLAYAQGAGVGRWEGAGR
ncbi:DUF2231 domain-containing protein [Actinophytocola gossypii]|uniref:DUF2231 domain-containing protein n=1 Tax=Actinophytocola gossypii TaxID=2812003 RepID=A0ABT2JIQ6_9PSEU|nr:DUF2231 domain-containing protein [Actinophytocola gossypii]MCT2587751.1 DUF2231 domain-containing protein [Actinophytocola gossypii]